MKAAVLIALSLALAAMGIYVAYASDAPGGIGGGFLLMAAAVVLAVRAARPQLPVRAGRLARTAGILLAAGAAFLIHTASVTAALFAQPPDVRSVSGSAPSPQWAAAVDRARPIV